MDLFIGEFVCGGGFLQAVEGDIPASLQSEGRVMLGALLEDFAIVCNRVHTILDSKALTAFQSITSSWELGLREKLVFHEATLDAPLWQQWIAAASKCDAALVVAPESGNSLAQGVATLQAAGLDMLNGFGDFLRCASDKLETARVLSAAGVPHPPTWLYSSFPSTHSDTTQGWVAKPRDGCGTDHVMFFDSIEKLRLAELSPDTLIQARVPGMPASVSVIAEGNEFTILPAVSQQFKTAPFAYQGGVGPLSEDLRQRAHHLALKTINAMPRTARGFFGLDLILGNSATQDFVIEVNPRVTTSYVGLRRIIANNLAARMLGLDRSSILIHAQANQVSWNASGEVFQDSP